jgi:DNA/RNA-binding domain of Phe-tRNA-synthetase-like protein
MDANHWQDLYRAALLELDLNKLRERVKAADEAIRVRVSLDGEIPSDERIALHDAMNALCVLKRAWR